MQGRDVYLVAAHRIPFCRAYTGYADQTNQQLLSAALKGLIAQTHLSGQRIGEVAAGAVVVHSADWNLARESVLDTSLDPKTPATTLQFACGTSVQATLMLAAKVASGQIDCAIAAGADSISDAPLTVQRKLAQRLVNLSRAKGLGAKLSAFKKFRFSELSPVPPGTGEPRTGLSMGQHCELMAKTWGISRLEQDRWAAGSHQKAGRALEQGFFDDWIGAHNGVTRDNILRADSNAESLATLKPAFDRATGTLTAANSTPLTDGASAVLIATREWAEARGLPILARIVDGHVSGNDFTQGEGLLMAPTETVFELLNRQNLTLQEFDLYEIHEAFAAQVLCTLKAWESDEYCQSMGAPAALGAVDPDKINLTGSSLALGHPFAATGARVIGTAGRLLAQQGQGRALVSVCTAGGMGAAMILER